MAQRRTVVEKSGHLSRQDNGTVELTGQFDHHSILAVKAEGEAIIKSLSEQPYRVDLSGVEATDSVFVALLLSWLRFCEARSVAMELVGAPKRLLDMARVSGVDSVLPFEGAKNEMPENDPLRRE